MLTKEDILERLRQLNNKYEVEGLSISGLFGSYAKDRADEYSDIDVVYDLDFEKFSQKYQGGFKKLNRLEDIKKELEDIFKVKVDFVPRKNDKILEGMVSV